MRPTLAFAFISVLCPGLAAAADAPVRLAPHKVIYDLSLANARGARGVEAVRGRIAFDFTGDACEGYMLKYRQVTVIESTETGKKTSDLRTANYESGDGRTFRFRNDNVADGGGTKTLDGEAERRVGSLAIQLKGPKRESVTAQGDIVFPNAQMKELIAAARAGKTTFSSKVFDGSDNGRKVYESLAIIGQAVADDGQALEEPARQAPLRGMRRWPVTLSYFNEGRADQTPAYVLGFDLYENGISRALRLDYGEFALKGEMRSLELLPESSCQR